MYVVKRAATLKVATKIDPDFFVANFMLIIEKSDFMKGGYFYPFVL